MLAVTKEMQLDLVVAEITVLDLVVECCTMYPLSVRINAVVLCQYRCGFELV